MKKLPKKYAGLLFTFYTSAMMVLIVSGVLVALNTGLSGAAGEVLPDYLAGCLRQPAGGAPAGGETGSGERGEVERFEAA